MKEEDVISKFEGDKHILEVLDVNLADKLYKTGKFCQAIYSPKRDCYILIRKVRK